VKRMQEQGKETVLEVKNLEVTYETDAETVHAVNGISFSLGREETLGLVGETGAGKTTTALAIIGLLPDRTGHVRNGEIYLNGKNLLKASKSEMLNVRGEKISMIFQDPMSSLNPVFTIGKQIRETLEFHNHKKRSKAELEKIVDETLEMVGIPASRKNEYPHQFSGGMKQRVIIAIALACEPILLLADEPTTALDVTIQAQVLAMMNDLKKRLGTSVVMITHDLGIIAETCDKVAVMYAGEIIEFGTLEDVFEGDKHHPYTTGLFGSIPDLEDEKKRLSPIDGLMPDPTNLPKGCSFSTRCPYCMEKCRVEKPPYYVDNEHRIRCHLYSEGGI